MTTGMKALAVMLALATWAPCQIECTKGGRDISSNEFPYLAYIQTDKVIKCSGLIYGSLTVITSYNCLPQPSGPASKGTGVIPGASVFATPPNDKQFDIQEQHLNPNAGDDHVKGINYLVLNLIVPGIEVAMDGTSAGTGPAAIEMLNNINKMSAMASALQVGLVFGSDKKVATMTMMTPEDCIAKTAPLFSADSTLNGATVTNAHFCAQMGSVGPSTGGPDTDHSNTPVEEPKMESSDAPSQSNTTSAVGYADDAADSNATDTSTNSTQEHIDEPVDPDQTPKSDPIGPQPSGVAPPGIVCDTDPGSPFVVNGIAVGVMVKSWCDSDPEIALFQMIIPESDSWSTSIDTEEPEGSDVPTEGGGMTDHPAPPTKKPVTNGAGTLAGFALMLLAGLGICVWS